MPRTPTTTIFCPAGRFTQVIWVVHPRLPWVILRYRTDVGGAFVDWRRFSVGVPPYWQGSFIGTTDFVFWVSDIYASLEFKPNRDVSVSITPI